MSQLLLDGSINEYRGLEALLEICQTIYQGKTVAFHPGDDWDPPGWRAYMICGQGLLLDPGTFTHPIRKAAEMDLQSLEWGLDSRGNTWPKVN